MAELTSKERVQKLFKREPVDRMPCFSGMGAVVAPAIKEMGVNFAKIHVDPDLMAKSALGSAKMYGMDGLVVPYDMATVAEAMGRGITLYEDSEDILYPTVPNKWETLEEVDIPDDFMTRARMPVVDKAFELVKKDGMAVGAWVLGPFTLAGQVIELGLLLKGAKKNKEQVEAFLEKMTKATITQAKHYESLGVDYLTVREMGSGTDLISPRMWKQLIQPNLIKIFKAITTIPTVNHICGSTDMIIEMMNECSATAVSVDQKNNIAESRQKLGNDALILGNFDPYGMLCQAETTPAKVEETIKKCIDDGVDAVWPGCDIWPDIIEDNMKAYANTVKEYGKKASPAVGRL